MSEKYPSLEDLLASARNHKWTEAERRAHAISFAWGNVHLHNPAITRADIERAYDELHGSATRTTTEGV
jgi:hypothetical protein